VLETVDLTIRFGGHVAVDAVSCRFEPGTLTSIVGPNGAGKTTYFNLISGQLQASAGRVLLDGEDLTRLPAPLRTRRGLGRAFQLTQLFPNLSVLENVRLAVQAREPRRRRSPRRARSVQGLARPRRLDRTGARPVAPGASRRPRGPAGGLAAARRPAQA
jgi:branched-chain amino acid transport system ATP-binding protein